MYTYICLCGCMLEYSGSIREAWKLLGSTLVFGKLELPSWETHSMRKSILGPPIHGNYVPRCRDIQCLG